MRVAVAGQELFNAQISSDGVDRDVSLTYHSREAGFTEMTRAFVGQPAEILTLSNFSNGTRVQVGNTTLTPLTDLGKVIGLQTKVDLGGTHTSIAEVTALTSANPRVTVYDSGGKDEPSFVVYTPAVHKQGGQPYLQIDRSWGHGVGWGCCGVPSNNAGPLAR